MSFETLLWIAVIASALVAALLIRDLLRGPRRNEPEDRDPWN